MLFKASTLRAGLLFRMFSSQQWSNFVGYLLAIVNAHRAVRIIQLCGLDLEGVTKHA